MNITNITFDGIDHSDYPDYCDAYIATADKDGTPMTEDELEKLNEDRFFVHEQLMKYLY